MLHIYGGREEDIGKAVFVIVGMDTKTKKPCAVPPLEPFSKVFFEQVNCCIPDPNPYNFVVR